MALIRVSTRCLVCIGYVGVKILVLERRSNEFALVRSCFLVSTLFSFSRLGEPWWLYCIDLFSYFFNWKTELLPLLFFLKKKLALERLATPACPSPPHMPRIVHAWTPTRHWRRSSAQNYSELGVVHKTTLAWHEKDVSKVSAKKLNKTLALVVNLIHLALQARLYFSSPVALPIQGTKARPLFRCIKF